MNSQFPLGKDFVTKFTESLKSNYHAEQYCACPYFYGLFLLVHVSS